MQTHPPEDQLAVVLGQRQLIAICCMFLTVLGLVATLAYVAGRSITAAQMQPMESNKPGDPVRPALVVDSAGPNPMQARAASIPSPAQQTPAAPMVIQPPAPTPPVTAAPKQPPAAPVRLSKDLPPEPTKGEIFWQVGLVERGMAPVFIRYMQELNLDARIAAGNSTNTRRVLVGPVSGQTETARIKQVLDDAGFQSFLKTY